MDNIRKNFPYLKSTVNKRPLIYFDSAATTQKPQGVIDAITEFYSHQYGNVHRGIYKLSEHATELFESARVHIAEFIGAQDSSEVIFTSGTTEGINLIASTWGEQHIKAGDEIVISALEHHSNLLPWQQLCIQKKAQLKIIPVLSNGTLDYQAAAKLITSQTKLVAIVHVSNFLGTEIDVKKIAGLAHNVGAKILVDAAQSVPYQKVNVKDLDCDFLAFSGHKMLGPTGVGILYIKKELQSTMPPYQFGGGMVYEADYDQATWLTGPRKFEAGTPPIAQVIGLEAAVNYLKKSFVTEDIRQLTARLCKQTIEGLSRMQNIQILGPQEELMRKGHLVSFVVKSMHAHDVAAQLDKYGICVRAGHHCAQPLAKQFGLTAAVRVSFYIYNTEEEVNYFLEVMSSLLRN